MMYDQLKLLLLIAIASLLPVANGQDITAEVAIRNTVMIETPVHFRGTDGQDLLVDAGLYWVTPAEESLDLLRLADGTDFTIRAMSEELTESPEESIALSTPGTEEQPDIHSVAYISSDGTQLIAEGSYSGIEARGALGDAARRKAAAARAAARRAAAEAKRKAQGAAAEFRRRKEQLALQLRKKARSDLKALLSEIATVEQNDGRQAALRLSARYAPRLAAAGIASFSPEQRRKILAAGARELQANLPFIGEVLGRSRNIAHLVRDGRNRLNDTELAEVRQAIFGSGPNALQHPFASRAVTTRGIGDDVGPSWSVGAGVDLALVGGISIGAAQSFPFNPANLGTCTYISVSADAGVQEEVEANASIGFYLGNHTTLGGSPGGWLGGLEVAVNLGATAFGGAEVVLLFGIPDEGLAYIPLTGIQVGVSGGEGAEVAVAIGYGLRVACI